MLILTHALMLLPMQDCIRTQGVRNCGQSMLARMVNEEDLEEAKQRQPHQPPSPQPGSGGGSSNSGMGIGLGVGVGGGCEGGRL